VERSATIIFATAAIMLVLMIVLLISGKGRRRFTRKGVADDMRDFARSNFDFVDRLVLENNIRNVILYKFVDGYLEDRRPGVELTREEDRMLARAARSAIKAVLESPPVMSEENGGGGRYESFEVAVESWRRIRGDYP
jgi:hypothetical protein